MDKQITIRMPKELLAKWLAALRSGEYKQGVGQLKSDGGYCCLGVLQMVTDGNVEVEKYGPALLPSLHWLAEHGITFGTCDEDKAGEGHSVSPFLPALRHSASNSNDMGAWKFSDIADAIEACAEGYEP